MITVRDNQTIFKRIMQNVRGFVGQRLKGTSKDPMISGLCQKSC